LTSQISTKDWILRKLSQGKDNIDNYLSYTPNLGRY